MFDSIFSSVRVIVGAAFNIGSLLFDKYILSGTDDSTYYLLILSAVIVYWFLSLIFRRRRRRSS